MVSNIYLILIRMNFYKRYQICGKYINGYWYKCNKYFMKIFRNYFYLMSKCMYSDLLCYIMFIYVKISYIFFVDILYVLYKMYIIIYYYIIQ